MILVTLWRANLMKDTIVDRYWNVDNDPGNRDRIKSRHSGGKIESPSESRDRVRGQSSNFKKVCFDRQPLYCMEAVYVESGTTPFWIT